MTDPAGLPPEFSDLAPFVDVWNLSTFAERFRHRRATSVGDLRAFYDAMLPLLPKLLSAVRREGVKGTVQGKTLENLILSFAHVSLSVEKLGPKELEHAKSVAGMKIREVAVTSTQHQNSSLS